MMKRDAPIHPPFAAILAASCLLSIPWTASPARGAMVPAMDLREMAGRAEVIVLGTVEEAQPAWAEGGRLIVTRVTIGVEKPLKGGPRSRVEFTVVGGRVGGTTLVASGAPVFRPGERVVLFLDRSPAPGEPAEAIRARPLGVTGWNLGAMPVRRDPATGRSLVHPRVESDPAPGRDGRPGPPRGPEGPIDLETMLRRIEAALAAPAPGAPR